MILGLSFWLGLSAATVSGGESGALLIGMRDSAGPAPWMTGLNVSYAVTDIALGLIVGAAELTGQGDSWYAKAALGAMALTCATRAIEFLCAAENPFCANGSLFVMDVIKLALAAGAFVVVLYGK